MKPKRLALLTAVIAVLLLVFLDLRVTSHPKPALASGDITVTATLGGLASGWPVSHGTQNDRLFDSGTTSACTLPKKCPGTIGIPGTRSFDQYRFTNISTNAACVTVSFTVTGPDFLQMSAYTAPYDPTNLCANYLADVGFGLREGGHRTMSFTWPPARRST